MEVLELVTIPVLDVPPSTLVITLKGVATNPSDTVVLESTVSDISQKLDNALYVFLRFCFCFLIDID